MSSLLLPPTAVFLVMLLAAAFSIRRAPLPASVVAVGAALLLVASMPVVGARLLERLAGVHRQIPEATDLARTQAIVIISTGRRSDSPEYGGYTVDPITLERVRYGAHLHRRTGLPILVSGGGGWRDIVPPVSSQMAHTLQDDYRVAATWTEDQANTTAENAAFAAALLHPQDIRTIALVTHGWHMRRARYVFERAGFEVIPAPTGFGAVLPSARADAYIPSPLGLLSSYYAIHEWVGMRWYQLRY
ncbi:MAG TPA: YdcF family protein [Azospirillaceae bacterium]|nr:YdcF family protein [Azospirillaceae bacterium]